MLYEYSCNQCGVVIDSLTFRRIGEGLDDCSCGGEYIRMVSNLQVAPPSPEPYFNHSVGQYVTSNRDFEEKLRIGSELASESTGIPHSFSPVYPSEARAVIANTSPDTDRSDHTLNPPHPTRRIFT